MRQSIHSRFNDQATITREEKTGTTATNEPTTTTTTVASGVPCQYLPEGSSFVREDSGTYVQKPARLRVGPDVDIREGDQVEIGGLDPTFEVRGVGDMQDHRRARTIAQQCDLEKISAGQG